MSSARANFPDDDAQITATDAKKVFKLTDGDLADLAAEVKANPRRRAGPPMRLFRVGDVYAASSAKHASNPRFHPDRSPTPRCDTHSDRRDTVCARAASRLLPGKAVPTTEPGATAWTRVVQSHRDSPRTLSQQEIARRWHGEMALMRLSDHERWLVTLGRNLEDGPPSAEDVPVILRGAVSRYDRAESLGSDFWTFCGSSRKASAITDDSGAALRDIERAHERFRTLNETLGERNLDMRSDSSLCRQYVLDGRDNRGVTEVVDIMEEMSWLHRHESLLYSSTRRTLFENALSHARESGGWVPHDEVEDIGHGASESAKQRIADQLARGASIPDELRPIPAKMRRRIARIQERIAAQQRERERRWSLVQKAFELRSLLEASFMALAANDIDAVPNWTLMAQLDAWIARRLDVFASLRSRKLGKQIEEVRSRVRDIVVGALSSTGPSVTIEKGKHYQILRDLVELMGLTVHSAKGVRPVDVRCERTCPFKALEVSEW